MTLEITRRIPPHACTLVSALRVPCERPDDGAEAGRVRTRISPVRVRAAGTGSDAGSDRPLSRFAAAPDFEGVDLAAYFAKELP